MLKKQCVICQQMFSKEYSCSLKRWNEQRRYCSIVCKGKASRGQVAHNKAKVSKTCQQCSKTFEVSPYRKDTAKFCSRACIGRSRGGVKSPHWQGGITDMNKAIRNSELYRMWRLEVFERDNFTCVQCGERGGKLEADHIKLFSKYPELRFETSNGQTLCKPCHKQKTRIDLGRKVAN